MKSNPAGPDDVRVAGGVVGWASRVRVIPWLREGPVAEGGMKAKAAGWHMWWEKTFAGCHVQGLAVMERGAKWAAEKTVENSLEAVLSSLAKYCCVKHGAHVRKPRKTHVRGLMRGVIVCCPHLQAAGSRKFCPTHTPGTARQTREPDGWR